MKDFRYKAAGLAMVIVSLACASGARAQPADVPTHPPDAVQAQLQKLLDAIQADDYNAFTANGEDAFKAAMTKQNLDGVSGEFGPRLKAGYTALYLTSMNQKGYQVYVWKLVFKDAGDDYLVTLSMKDGKVGGFFLI